MASSKYYPVHHHTAAELFNHMCDYFTDVQGMEIQCIPTAAGTVIQARVKGGQYKKFLGLDRAATLRLTEVPGVVNVEIGEAKWIDKSVVMTISMFVLWPLTVTSGVGFYKQKKLLDDLSAEMDRYMA